MTDSPCTAVCTLDADDMCMGCYRTAEEIAQWASMTEGQRKQVIELLEGRQND